MADSTISTSTSSPDSSVPTPPRDDSVPTWSTALGQALAGWFGVDVRSLALMRIGLGLVNFVDIAWRMQDIPVFYAGGGLFSSQTARSSVEWPVNYSLYFLDGSNEWAAFLMVLHLVVTATLIFGFRSRTSAFLVWILLLSLHNRNPLVLNGGDVLIRSFLFWAMFLPIGEVWSLDAWSRKTALRKAGPRRLTIVSPASAALVIQTLVLYFSAGYFKWNQDWLSGEALDWTLRLETYNRPLAEWFVQFTTLNRYGTLATPILETYLPILWFVPGLVRLALWPIERSVGSPLRLATAMPAVQTVVRCFVAATLAAFHLPIELLMWIGYFSYVCWSAWLGLVPTGFWERLARFVRSVRLTGSGAALSPFQIGAEALRGAAAGLCLVYVVLWNVRNVSVDPGYERLQYVLPAQTDGFGFLLGLNQRWNMFQYGPKREGWAAAHATLMNGETRNVLFRGGPADFSRPEGLRSMFPTDRWRKFFNNIGNKPDDRHAPEAALYIARRWNETHSDEEQIFSLDLYWLTQPLARDGSSQSEQPVDQKLLARIEWGQLYGDWQEGDDTQDDLAEFFDLLVP